MVSKEMEDKRRTPITQSTLNPVRTIMMMRMKATAMMSLKKKTSVEQKGPSKDRKTSSKMIQVKKMTIHKKSLKAKVKYLKINQPNLLKEEDQEVDLQNHLMLISIQDKRLYLLKKLQDQEVEEDQLLTKLWINLRIKLQNKVDLKEQSLEISKEVHLLALEPNRKM